MTYKNFDKINSKKTSLLFSQKGYIFKTSGVTKRASNANSTHNQGCCSRESNFYTFSAPFPPEAMKKILNLRSKLDYNQQKMTRHFHFDFDPKMAAIVRSVELEKSEITRCHCKYVLGKAITNFGNCDILHQFLVKLLS